MTASKLKWIALISMLLDHYGHVFEVTELRYIGRIAFPIFIFLIAEGAKHTRNMEKYLLRLGVFALISEIPFDLMLYIHSTPGKLFRPEYQNVFFTLFLGCFAVYIHQKIVEQKKIAFGWPISLICCAALGVSAFLLITDGDFYGVFGIYFAYLAKDKFKQALVILIMLFTLYWGANFYFLFALISVALILLYNGEPGKRFKWLFYWAYPAHMLILYLWASWLWWGVL